MVWPRLAYSGIDNGVYLSLDADGLGELGKTGIDVVTRLLGMLLAALGAIRAEGFFAFLPANGGAVRTGIGNNCSITAFFGRTSG